MPKIVKQSVKNKTKPKKKGGSTLAGMQSAWDFVDGIKMLIYGRSGTGKTTFWSSFPGPILALICSGGRQPGELRSINTPELRKKITPVIVEESTQIRDVLSEVEDFGTVVLDHGTGLQD